MKRDSLPAQKKKKKKIIIIKKKVKGVVGESERSVLSRLVNIQQQQQQHWKERKERKSFSDPSIPGALSFPPNVLVYLTRPTDGVEPPLHSPLLFRSFTRARATCLPP